MYVASVPLATKSVVKVFVSLPFTTCISNLTWSPSGSSDFSLKVGVGETVAFSAGASKIGVDGGRFIGCSATRHNATPSSPPDTKN